MITPPPPSLMDGIEEGIKAAGQALLEEARRTGEPLVTWRNGAVVRIDANGRQIPSPPGATERPA